jgi:hypothetical protein
MKPGKYARGKASETHVFTQSFINTAITSPFTYVAHYAQFFNDALSVSLAV